METMVRKPKLIIDLGNSETRMYVLDGGKWRTETLSNRFVELPEGYSLPEEYKDGNTVLFKFPGVTGLIANGELVETEFMAMSMRPSALEKKYKSLISELSLRLVFMKAFEIVNPGINDEIEWNVTILLPPSDLEFGAAQLADKIKTVGEINFMQPKVSKKVNVGNVWVLPEGFSAFMGVLMNKGKVLRKSHAYLANSTTLVVDIGAGTTDFCIIKNSKLIDNTLDSFELGGNNISQKVRKALKAEGYSYPDQEIQEAIIKGFVPDGVVNKDIRDLIDAAKDDVAKSIVGEIQAFFESTQYPIRTIQYVLVCGGGAEEHEDSDMRSLADYVVKHLKSLSKNIEKVELPQIRGTDGNLKDVSARRLNIMGATILSE